jgi:hypothetical protein
MKATMNEVEINGVVYVPKDTAASSAPAVDGLPLVLIRTQSAGVHFGYLKGRNGSEVSLINARRIWYWDGAASLSQLAVDGVSKPQNCKFTVVVPEITVLGVLEIIPVSSAAQKSINGVTPWK